jgi:hypothetical protein
LIYLATAVYLLSSKYIGIPVDPEPKDSPELLQQLRDALNAIPHVQASSSLEMAPAQSYRVDAVMHVVVAGHALQLTIDTVQDVYPRDASRLLWARSPTEQPDSPSWVFMLAARAISPGAREVLRRESIGYFDSGGSLFISAGPIYILIDKPPPKAIARSIRSVFVGRRAHVLQLLLLHPEQWFNGSQLARQAHVSPATVSQLLKELERLDWVTSRGRGPWKERKVNNPGDLLDAFAANYDESRHKRFRKFFVPPSSEKSMIDVASGFDAAGVKYAVSFEAAGQLYAPYLSSVSQLRCRAVESPALALALEKLGARSVTEGANLWIASVGSERDLTATEQIHQISVANPVQVYLDLINSGGRGKELAHQLRRERLKY